MNLLLVSTASAIIDMLIIIVVGLFCFLGYKSGFVKSLISTFGDFFALLLSVLLCSAVATFLETKFNFISSIANGISGILVQIFGEDIMLTTLREASDVSLNNSNLTAWLIKIVLEVKVLPDIPLDKTVSDIVSPVFGYYIACTISVIGLFIITRIALFIVGEIVKDAHDIKLVGATDKTLGALFGFIKGIIVFQIFILVVKVIPLGFFQKIYLGIEESVFAGLVNKLNLFTLIMNLVSKVNLPSIIKAILIAI